MSEDPLAELQKVVRKDNLSSSPPLPPVPTKQSILGRISLALALILWGYWGYIYYHEYVTRNEPKSQMHGLALGLYFMPFALVAMIIGAPLALAGILNKRRRHGDSVLAFLLHIAFIFSPFLVGILFKLLIWLVP